MIAQLQLNNFFVDFLSVKTNPSFDPKVKEGLIAGKINCATAIGIPKDGAQVPYRVILDVSIDPASEKPALEPYEVKIKIVGFFSFKGEMTNDQKEKMLSLNGASILYGAARGIVAQTTGVGVFEKYILPAVNFVEMSKQKEGQATKEIIAEGKKRKPSKIIREKKLKKKRKAKV